MYSLIVLGMSQKGERRVARVYGLTSSYLLGQIVHN